MTTSARRAAPSGRCRAFAEKHARRARPAPTGDRTASRRRPGRSPRKGQQPPSAVRDVRGPSVDNGVARRRPAARPAQSPGTGRARRRVVRHYGYWGSRPRTRPRAVTAPMASTGSAWIPTACPPTRTRTLVDPGFAGCPGRDPQPDPPPSAYTNGVVTPHAAFLALRYAPETALTNLQPARPRLPRPLRQVGVPRQRQRRQRARVGLLPLARPGHDHGRPRQRARRRRAAARVRRPASSTRCGR